MKTTAQKLAEKYMRCMIEIWEEVNKNMIESGHLSACCQNAVELVHLVEIDLSRISNAMEDFGYIDTNELKKYAREYQAITEAPDEAELHEAELANQVDAIKYICKCGEVRETEEDLKLHYAYAHEG